MVKKKKKHVYGNMIAHVRKTYISKKYKMSRKKKSKYASLKMTLTAILGLSIKSCEQYNFFLTRDFKRRSKLERRENSQFTKIKSHTLEK